MKHIKLKRLWNGLASIRDNIVKKAISKNESIEISVDGMKGKMVLTPEELKSKSFKAVVDEFDSKYVKGMKYSLVDFKWSPNEI